MNKIIFSICFVFLVLSFSRTSFAIDEKQGGFFSDDFAKTPFGKNSQDEERNYKKNSPVKKNEEKKINEAPQRTSVSSKKPKSVMDMAGGEDIKSLGAIVNGLNAVSYTHLTLPTICSV